MGNWTLGNWTLGNIDEKQAKEAETRIAADGTTEIILTPVNEVIVMDGDGDGDGDGDYVVTVIMW